MLDVGAQVRIQSSPDRKGLSRAWSWMVLRKQSVCSLWVNTSERGSWISPEQRWLSWILAYLELISHIGIALNRIKDWLKSPPSPSSMTLGLSLWFWEGNFWEIERSNKWPSLSPPPQALLTWPVLQYFLNAEAEILSQSGCNKEKGGQLYKWTKWLMHNFLSKESLSGCGY